MIPEDKIAEIRDRVDLVALINEHVPLKRQGTRFVGLCPFHQEKTPSFGVSRGKQFYYCFGCHASGDVISFVVQQQGYSFVEAVEMLAERVGVELPKVEAPEQAVMRRARSRREALYAVMEEATAYYEAQLREHPHAGLAREAVAQRAIEPATAQTFRLGYAPHGWDGLVRHLSETTHSAADAAELGLIAPRKSGEGYYDRFRHRLMFPVVDAQGRVVAFSGRVLPPVEPDGETSPAKYINSPEGPLYTKGAVLFGLHQARAAARQQGVVVLCEGNFDLLAIHQAGVPHVLAPLGTAFTLAQAKLIRRYAERLVVIFDGDRAGLAATEKAIELGREAGLAVHAASLPAGEDPDSFVRSRGVEVLCQLLDGAPAALDFLIGRLAEQAGDPGSVARGIRSLGPTLAGLESPVERDLYIERIGRRFGVRDPRVVRAELRQGVLEARQGASQATRRRALQDSAKPRSADAEGNASQPTAQTSQGAHVSVSARAPESFTGLEPEVIAVLLEHPTLFETPEAKKFEELLTDGDLRAIFRVTADMVSSTGEVRAAELLESFANSPARAWLGRRLSQERGHTLEYANAALRDSIPRLHAGSVQRQRAALNQQILRARSEGDDERAAALMRQRDELARAQQMGGPER